MDQGQKNLQGFTTIIGFSLPILQFFYGLLSDQVSDIFLFRDYFLIVSVFTAVVSYISIGAFKTKLGFEWYPLQKRRQRKNIEWNQNTDRNIHETSQISEYIRKNKFPHKLKALNSDNISQKLFIPLIIVSFVLFYYLGLEHGLDNFTTASDNYVILSLLQSIFYACFVCIVVLAFAIRYLMDDLTNKYNKSQTELFDKVINLARERNSFGEFKVISSLAHKVLYNDSGHITHYAYLLDVAGRYFIIAADSGLFQIAIASEYNSIEEASEEFWK